MPHIPPIAQILLAEIPVEVFGWSGLATCLALCGIWFFLLKRNFVRAIRQGKMPTQEISRFRTKLCVGWVLLLAIGLLLVLFRAAIFVDILHFGGQSQL